VLVHRFDFSEAQAGKSACDRMSATIKGNIRRYVNEGNDCENSSQFIQAAKTTSFTTIIAGRLIYDNVPEQKMQWAGVKKFNNILYEVVDNPHNYRQSTTNTALRATVWRSFGIGAGKQYELQEKVVNMDRIEIIDEHINNEWKFDGLPCHHKGIYEVFV
jgi:hypothetical protein